jgi:hypothetical protein
LYGATRRHILEDNTRHELLTFPAEDVCCSF